jgi:hypothetical protein
MKLLLQQLQAEEILHTHILGEEILVVLVKLKIIHLMITEHTMFL